MKNKLPKRKLHMKFITAFYNKLFFQFTEQTKTTGLGIFRILYCFVLFAEIFQLFYFRHLIFDKEPFASPPYVNSTTLIFWFVSVFCLLIGFYTRVAALLNYLLSLIVYSTFFIIGSYLYALDYCILGVNFLLIFIPVSMSLSIDRLLEKLKYSSLRKDFIPAQTTRAIYPVLFFFIALGLSYFESAAYKLSSPIWKHGLGFWAPSSLPHFTYLDVSFLLNNEFLSKFFGYVVLLFELVFIFLFWIKRIRIPLIITGIIFHLSIAFIFPIPLFGIFGAFCYVLLFPDSFWEKLGKKIKNKKTSLTVYYDEDCPLCNRTKIIVTHFDIFNKIEFKGVQIFAQQQAALAQFSKDELLDNIYSVNAKGKVFIGLASYSQMFLRIWFLWPLYIFVNLPGIHFIAAKSYNFIAQNRFREKCDETTCAISYVAPPQVNEVKIFRNLSLTKFKFFIVHFFILYILIGYTLTFFFSKVSTFEKFERFNQETIGIVAHKLFLDAHYENYKHIIAIAYVDEKTKKEIWLPIINEKGQASYYITGRQWCLWTFAVNSTHIVDVNLENGIRKYSKFWLKTNYPNLQTANFIIKVKPINTIDCKWQPDFLHKQMKRPWVNAGTVTWHNDSCTIVLPNFKNINP